LSHSQGGFGLLFNYTSKEVVVKIVYYGPALSGKTSNLEYIYKKTNPQTRGKLISLATETDRTLFFDLLPMDLGEVKGFNIKLQLYTVPGQVKYNSTRKLVLKGVDAIVFVADSNRDLIGANIESMNNLKANLEELGIDYYSIPMALQFNKQDIQDRVSDEELNSVINDRNLEVIKSCSIDGTGVFETLKHISRLVIEVLNKKNETNRQKTTSAENEDLNERIAILKEKIAKSKDVVNELLSELTQFEQKLSDLRLK